MQQSIVKFKFINAKQTGDIYAYKNIKQNCTRR